jgi:hypothetical protein
VGRRVRESLRADGILGQARARETLRQQPFP